jgi:hypothetical protein
MLFAVVSLNLRRRHLDESQRAMVADNIARFRKGDNQHTSIDVSTPTQVAAAKLLDVGLASVQRARIGRGLGTPELIAKVERGDVAVSAA